MVAALVRSLSGPRRAPTQHLEDRVRAFVGAGPAEGSDLEAGFWAGPAGADTCPVCLEDLLGLDRDRARLHGCRHGLCLACLQGMEAAAPFGLAFACPLCRAPITGCDVQDPLTLEWSAGPPLAPVAPPTIPLRSMAGVRFQPYGLPPRSRSPPRNPHGILASTPRPAPSDEESPVPASTPRPPPSDEESPVVRARIFASSSGGPALVHLVVQGRRQATDFVLLYDTSGSMERRLSRYLEATCLFVEALSENVRLSLVAFSSTSRQVTPLQPLTRANKDALIAALRALTASGSTYLADGIRRCHRVLQEAGESVSDDLTLVVVTDGEASSRDQWADRSLPALRAEFPRASCVLVTVGGGIDASARHTLIREGEAYIHDTEEQPVAAVAAQILDAVASGSVVGTGLVLDFPETDLVTAPPLHGPEFVLASASSLVLDQVRSNTTYRVVLPSAPTSVTLGGIRVDVEAGPPTPESESERLSLVFHHRVRAAAASRSEATLDALRREWDAIDPRPPAAVHASVVQLIDDACLLLAPNIPVNNRNAAVSRSVTGARSMSRQVSQFLPI